MDVSGEFHDPVASFQQKSSPYPYVMGSVGHRAGLDVLEKKNISCHCREFIPKSQS